MRIDEAGRVWFEKGDRVKPKFVHLVEEDPETGKNRKVLAPHPKALGSVEHSDDGYKPLRQADTVLAVDHASGQIQLSTWIPFEQITDPQTGRVKRVALKTGLRTRWDPCDWYDLAEPASAESEPTLPASPRGKKGGRSASAPSG